MHDPVPENVSAIAERLPEWARPLVEVLVDPTVLVALGAVSALLFAASLIGVPLVIVRMPVDYLSRGRPKHRPRSFWQWVGLVAKNGLGVVILALGVAMLVLPGQGLLAILVSLFLLNFPGKRRLERRLVAYPPVLRAITRLRQRAGRPPLCLDPECTDADGDAT
jgi:hypothetical protein